MGEQDGFAGDAWFRGYVRRPEVSEAIVYVAMGGLLPANWSSICGTGAVIADKGYDADALVKTIRATWEKVVIPPRSNRKTKRRYSRLLYRTRNLVERLCNRIKHFRRVATWRRCRAKSQFVAGSAPPPYVNPLGPSAGAPE